MSIIEDVVRTQLEVVGLQQWTGGFIRASRVAGGLNTDFTALERQTLALGAAFGFGATLTWRLVGAIAQAGGELQRARIGFNTLLGSTQAANQMIKQLQDLALATPFDFPEMVKGAQQLMAFGVNTARVLPIMKALADGMAAAGKGTEEYSAALFALGKIQAHGKLMSRDILSMAASGVPIVPILQRELGVTQAQLANIGRLNISADRAFTAIEHGLEKAFGGAATKQVDTFSGALANFHDALFQVAGVASGGILGPFTSILNAGSSFLRYLRDAPGLASTLGVVLVGLGLTLTVLAIGFARAAWQAVFAARAFYQAGAAAATAEAAMGGGGATGTGVRGLFGLFARRGAAAAAASGVTGTGMNWGIWGGGGPVSGATAAASRAFHAGFPGAAVGDIAAGIGLSTPSMIDRRAELAGLSSEYTWRRLLVGRAAAESAAKFRMPSMLGFAARGGLALLGAYGLGKSVELGRNASDNAGRGLAFGGGFFSGALSGGAMGSFFGPTGTVVGAIIGGITGAIVTGYNIVANKQQKTPEAQAQQAREDRQASTAEAQLEELRQLRQLQYEVVHGREGAKGVVTGMRQMRWALGGL